MLAESSVLSVTKIQQSFHNEYSYNAGLISSIPRSIEHVPDELLRDILLLVLHVPNNEFFAWPDIRRGLREDLPSDYVPPSHVLLVCKRFLRVGTPLLYNAVRIASQDSTRAIAEFLRTHADIGRNMRRLRLENGYGREMELVVKHTPNVEELYLYPDVKIRYSIVGIRKALLTLNPTHLWVERGWLKPNKHSAVLHPVLYSVLRSHWTKLKTVTFEDQWDLIHESFIGALREAPALEQLSISEPDAVLWLSLGIVQTIAQNPRLKKIVCRGGRFTQRIVGVIMQAVKIEERVKEMFEYTMADTVIGVLKAREAR